MFILDGHAHLYPDELAQKVVGRFTEFHRMNPRGGRRLGRLGFFEASRGKYGIMFQMSPKVWS